MRLRADLHTHTYCSDGKQSPEHVALEAKRVGLDLIAVTDHDTTLAYPELKKVCERENIRCVTGIEVSAYIGSVKIHILGWGMDINSPKFKEYLETLKKNSRIRTEDLLSKLAAHGVNLSMEEVLKERTVEGAPTHITYVTRAGAKKLGVSPREFFNTYLALGRPCYSSLARPTPEGAVEIITSCGGAAAIAHPGRIEYPEGLDLETLIKRLLPYGLYGIEGVYTTHTNEETAYFKEMAAKYSLAVSGGSDTHFETGLNKIGYPEYYLDDSLAEKILH